MTPAGGREAWPARRRAPGGEGGIRTRDGLPHTAFPVRRPRPLGDLSAAEGTCACPTDVRERRSGGERGDAPPAGERQVLARRDGASGQGGGEAASERTQTSVSEGAESPNAGMARPAGERLAERVGFEPTVLSHTAFRERHHQPLGHLSAAEDTKQRDAQAPVRWSHPPGTRRVRGRWRLVRVRAR